MRREYTAFCVVVAPGTLLAACAGGDGLGSPATTIVSGEWRSQTDRITGAPISSAMLQSSRTAHSGLAATPQAMLQLACFKGQPIIRLAFAFQVGATSNSVFGYRFDEKPGHEINVHFLQGNDVFVIENKRDVAQFVSGLAAANNLYVQVRSLNKGRTSAEFRVSGGQPAIDAAFAGCPV